MEDSHGKEIDLQKTTVKFPGSGRPRIGKPLAAAAASVVNNSDPNKLHSEVNSLHLNGTHHNNNNNSAPFYEEITADPPPPPPSSCLARIDANSNNKKRHRRVKSNHKSDANKEEEPEGFEFMIVSLDNKQWYVLGMRMIFYQKKSTPGFIQRCTKKAFGRNLGARKRNFFFSKKLVSAF